MQTVNDIYDPIAYTLTKEEARKLPPTFYPTEYEGKSRQR